MFRHTIEFRQTAFSNTPERFDTVIYAVHHSQTRFHHEVLVNKVDIHQSIMATPPIGMDHDIRCHLFTDNGLQCCFRTIWHDLRINFSLAFQYAKDDCFIVSGTASNTLCAKVRFIDFYSPLINIRMLCFF